MAKIKAPIVKGNYAIVDDSLRRDVSHNGRGRGLSQLSEDLIAGKTCQVEKTTVLPDKTVLKYGYRLHYYTTEDGLYKVVWADPLED